MTKKEKLEAAARAARAAKANRRKQRAASKPLTSSAIPVNGGRRPGKRKRGNSVTSKNERLDVTGNITVSQVERAVALDPTAVLYGNAHNGHGRLLIYRESDS